MSTRAERARQTRQAGRQRLEQRLELAREQRAVSSEEDSDVIELLAPLIRQGWVLEATPEILPAILAHIDSVKTLARAATCCSLFRDALRHLNPAHWTRVARAHVWGEGFSWLQEEPLSNLAEHLAEPEEHCVTFEELRHCVMQKIQKQKTEPLLEVLVSEWLCSSVSALCWSGRRGTYYLGDQAGHLLEATTGATGSTVTVLGVPPTEMVTNEMNQPVEGILSVTAAPAAVVTGHVGGAVRWWRGDSGSYQVVQSTQLGTEHTKGVTAVVATGDVILSTSWDSTIRTWRDGMQLHVAREAAGQESITAAVLHRHLLTVGTFDGSIECWHVERCQRLWRTEGAHEGMVRCITAVGGLSSCVASVGWDGAIRIWDLNTAKCVCEKQNAHDGARVLSVDADWIGLTIATSGQDNSIRFWDVRKLQYSGASSRVGSKGSRGGCFGVIETTQCPQPGGSSARPTPLVVALDRDSNKIAIGRKDNALMFASWP